MAQNASTMYYISPSLICQSSSVISMIDMTPYTLTQGFPKIHPKWYTRSSLSEKANLSKTRFQEKNDSAAYTDHQVQFCNGFAIFHPPQGTHEGWKIAKKHNPIVKFGSVSGRIFA